MKKFVILGGGISGLSTAFFIKEFFQKSIITVVEQSNRVGGMISSVRQDKFAFEEGPRSIRRSNYVDPLNKIMSDIGLYSDIIPSETMPYSYIYHNEKMIPLPMKVNLSTLSRFRKAVGNQEILNLIKGRVKQLMDQDNKKNDQSMSEYFKNVMGEEITKKYIETVYYGIYGCSIDTLSTQLCYNKSHLSKYDKEQIRKRLPVSSEFEKFTTPLFENANSFRFEQGLEELPISLNKYLSQYQDYQLLYDSKVEAIAREDKQIILNNGSKIDYDYLITTIPTNNLQELFRNSKIEDQHISNMETASLYATNISFDTNIIPSDFKGFGYLINPNQNQKFIGVVVDSLSFPTINPPTQLSIMMQQNVKIDQIIEQLEKHLQIKIPEPSFINTRFWDKAFTVYKPNHKSLIEISKKQLKESNIILGGTVLYTPAIPELVYLAYENVRNLIQYN